MTDRSVARRSALDTRVTGEMSDCAPGARKVGSVVDQRVANSYTVAGSMLSSAATFCGFAFRRWR